MITELAEILVNVFGSLDSIESYMNVGEVCKLWKEVRDNNTNDILSDMLVKLDCEIPVLDEWHGCDYDVMMRSEPYLRIFSYVFYTNNQNVVAKLLEQKPEMIEIAATCYGRHIDWNIGGCSDDIDFVHPIVWAVIHNNIFLINVIMNADRYTKEVFLHYYTIHKSPNPINHPNITALNIPYLRDFNIDLLGLATAIGNPHVIERIVYKYYLDSDYCNLHSFWNGLLVAVYLQNIFAVQIILGSKYGKDVVNFWLSKQEGGINMVDYRTPLRWAVNNNNVAIAMLLVEYGADVWSSDVLDELVNITTAQYHNYVPLFYCVSHGSAEMLDYLTGQRLQDMDYWFGYTDPQENTIYEYALSLNDPQKIAIIRRNFDIPDPIVHNENGDNDDDDDQDGDDVRYMKRLRTLLVD